MPATRKPDNPILRQIRLHPALLLGLGAAGLAIVVAQNLLAMLNSWLCGWTAGAVVYVAVVVYRMTGATPASMRRRAEEVDEERSWILLMALAAAIVALAAVLVDLADARVSFNKATDAAIATISIVISWLFIHIVFTQHYAHEFYMERIALHFPDTKQPNFWDFAYFSFVIGMTYQVSDVSVSNTAFRKLVIAHALLSFLFNTVILALVISFAATLAS